MRIVDFIMLVTCLVISVAITIWLYTLAASLVIAIGLLIIGFAVVERLKEIFKRK
jgi:hypothetical protein